MQLRNTSKQYGLIAKSLHWIMALLIITAWMIGYYAVDLPNTKLQKMKLFDFHKSVGMVILMLVVIRLSWRLYNNAPESAVKSKLLRIAANIVHYLLYLFILSNGVIIPCAIKSFNIFLYFNGLFNIKSVIFL